MLNLEARTAPILAICTNRGWAKSFDVVDIGEISLNTARQHRIFPRTLLQDRLYCIQLAYGWIFSAHTRTQGRGCR
jgi:hypothetical protein